MSTIPRAGQSPIPPVQNTRKEGAPRVYWTPEAEADLQRLVITRVCALTSSVNANMTLRQINASDGGLAANRRVVITVQTG